MNEELEVLKTVTERLGRAGIPYLISGSTAASFYTVPRMTRDIDVVVEVKKDGVDRFVDLFRDDFYIEKESVAREVLREGIFNLIHNEHIVKIDFILRKSSAFQDSMFLRKKKVDLEGCGMWIISPEDLVLAKLLWAKDSRSELQLRDVRNIMRTVKGIDLEYVGEWVVRLGLDAVYNEVKP